MSSLRPGPLSVWHMHRMIARLVKSAFDKATEERREQLIIEDPPSNTINQIVQELEVQPGNVGEERLEGLKSW